MSIENLFLEAMSVSLSSTAMKYLVREDIPIISYSSLIHYSTIEEVFGPYKAIILFYENESKKIGHWTALLKYDNFIELYDPYAYHPKQLQDISPTSDRLVNDEYVLHKLIGSTNFKWNTDQIQEKSDDVNTCGRHVALRIRLYALSMDEFNFFMRSSYYTPDQLAILLTAMYSDDFADHTTS